MARHFARRVPTHHVGDGKRRRLEEIAVLVAGRTHADVAAGAIAEVVKELMVVTQAQLVAEVRGLPLKGCRSRECSSWSRVGDADNVAGDENERATARRTFVEHDSASGERRGEPPSIETRCGPGR